MKFYIVIDSKEFGEIKSETYEGEKIEYEKVVAEIPKTNKLDFYDENGDYVVIPESVVTNSLVYIKSA